MRSQQNGVDIDKVRELIEHLFRHKYGQLVGILTRLFGPENMSLAEDVAQEAMLIALKSWQYSGIPRNPGAWLSRVARNKAIDLLRHSSISKSRQIPPEQWEQMVTDPRAAVKEVFFSSELGDDQLKMIFICCHPSLPMKSRVALTLKIVGGFSVVEIARGLLSKSKSVAQLITRAKKKIAEEKIQLTLPSSLEITSRLDSVLRVLYLIFNEGYSAYHGSELIRKDLCFEAIRLVRLIAGNEQTCSPEVNALAALMLAQAARFPARLDDDGNLLLLSDQDRTRWDRRMISQALDYLKLSAEGFMYSEYHLEAAIAITHSVAESFDDTDWPFILSAYDQLRSINHSPVLELNRAVALSKVEGPEKAIKILEDLEIQGALKNYYLLPATLGTLYREMGMREKAEDQFRRAHKLAANEPVRKFIKERLTEH